MLAGRCIFFCVYLYVCILLLEVYIQGCVFIYKNAYLKRVYKKEKCIYYVAHFFCRQQPAGCLKCTHMHAHTKSLPSGQAIFQKMHTFAGIFFRWFYVYTCILYFSPLPILPAFFRSRHTHKNTPLPPSPISAIYFLHLFFFVSPNDRQRWQLRKILHKTKQEEKSCKRKSNKHPLQFHQDKEQRGNRRTKKTEKI